MKNIIRLLFKLFNIKITKRSNYIALAERLRSLENIFNVCDVFSESKSQLRQDLFVLNQLNFKKGGFFVEFGATNGFDYSNTYLLEKKFGWNGILAEPSIGWHNDLIVNRNCNIDKNCVWTKSNLLLDFIEVNDKELSTISHFIKSDGHNEKRKKGVSYKVNTISLMDLLKKYNAPKEIDYLSIDTEGSEYEILKNFNFEKYSFKVITVEHNYTSLRDKIFHLLSSKGYTRKLQNLSKWDDWYVK